MADCIFYPSNFTALRLSLRANLFVSRAHLLFCSAFDCSKITWTSWVCSVSRLTRIKLVGISVESTPWQFWVFPKLIVLASQRVPYWSSSAVHSRLSPYWTRYLFVGSGLLALAYSH